MKAKSLVAVEISDNTSGDHYWHGFGYITELSSDYPDDEASSYTFTVEGDGELYYTQLT